MRSVFQLRRISCGGETESAQRSMSGLLVMTLPPGPMSTGGLFQLLALATMRRPDWLFQTTPERNQRASEPSPSV
jgi:hypothetical protein